MPSYGYGYSKYITSEQGNLDISDLTSGRVYYNSVPKNVYYFKSINEYKDEGYLFYAADYPLYMQHPFPRFFKIASFNGTEIFGAAFVTDPSIPSGTPITPIMIQQNKIKYCIFSGDFNGEVTEENPSGVRLATTQNFEPCKRYTKYEVTDIGGSTTTTYTHHTVSDYYAYFGTLNSDGILRIFDTPLKKPTDTDIVVESVFNPYIVVTEYNAAMQGEINTWDEYSDTIGMEIINVLGEYIDVDDLPEEVTTSGAGGGNGVFSLNSTNIGVPALPTLGAANSGMITMYNPSISELNQLSRWLWSNDLLDNLTKMFAQPLDLIISLSISPVPPYALGAYQEVKIGGVGTNISMYKINNQYAQLDCGVLQVPEMYGSALDYGQYTKVSIYLPFCGIHQLKADEVMGSSLRVVYNVDLFSGACTAFILSINGDFNSILYSFEGNTAATLPLISRDFSGMYNALAQTGIAALSGGMSLGQIPDSAMQVMASKPTINRSGNASAPGGLLGVKVPYLIIEHPMQSLAPGYNKFVGYPSNITALLSSLKGYTEVDSVIASSLTCTKEEQDAIIARLKEGVII